jgi:hypothetical protein
MEREHQSASAKANGQSDRRKDVMLSETNARKVYAALEKLDPDDGELRQFMTHIKIELEDDDEDERPRRKPRAVDIRSEAATDDKLDHDIFPSEVEMDVTVLCLNANPFIDPDIYNKLGKWDDLFTLSEGREAAIWAYAERCPPRKDENIGDYERRIALNVYEALVFLDACLAVSEKQKSKTADDENPPSGAHPLDPRWKAKWNAM